MKKALRLVKQSLPSFNSELIYGFRKKQMESIIDMIDGTFKNVVERLERSDLTYQGYRILSPRERTEYELTNGYGGRNVMNILQNEVYLVAFMFNEAGKHYEILLYIPYEYDNSVVINGVKNFLEYTIFEKVFFKISEGINLKVRLPINFKGHKVTKMFSSIEKVKVFDSIINVKIHNKLGSKMEKTTLLHYILSYYGFEDTLKLFGYEGMIKIKETPEYGDNLANFDISSKRDSGSAYLVAQIDLLERDYVYKRLVSSLLHVFSLAEIRYSVKDIELNSISLFRLMLGTIIYDKKSIGLVLIKEHIDNHLKSLVTYIDDVAIDKLKDLNITTIWDFLVYVFINYEYISNDTRNNDLFSKRIELTETMVENLIIRPIYRSVYAMMGKSNVERSITKIDVKPNAIFSIYKILNKKASTFTYGSSLLIPYMRVIDAVTKDKANAGVDASLNHFDISFPLVKNVNYQSSSSPAKNGLLNYFLKVDERGNILKPRQELIDSLDSLK